MAWSRRPRGFSRSQLARSRPRASAEIPQGTLVCTRRATVAPPGASGAVHEALDMTEAQEGAERRCEVLELPRRSYSAAP